MATEDALAENAALAGDFRADTRLTARGAVMPAFGGKEYRGKISHDVSVASWW